MSGSARGARSPLALFARQELTLALHSRWTQTFAIVFTALAVAVAGSGYALSGGSGMQDFARTAASLVQLVLLIVPLAALLMGVLELAPERGAAELIFAQPIPRSTVLLGKLLGLFQALAAAEAVGFGVAGLLIFSQAGDQGIGGYLLLVLASLVTTSVFLSLAALLAATSIGRRRVRALALALVVWLVAVVLLDVAALGVATLLPSGAASRVLVAAALVNPVGAVRTGTLLAVEGTAAFGAASLAFLRVTGGGLGAGVLLCASLAGWVLVPAAVAVWRLRDADV